MVTATGDRMSEAVGDLRAKVCLAWCLRLKATKT